MLPAKQRLVEGIPSNFVAGKHLEDPNRVRVSSTRKVSVCEAKSKYFAVRYSIALYMYRKYPDNNSFILTEYLIG